MEPLACLATQYFWGSTTLNGNSTANNGVLTNQQITTTNPSASFYQTYTYDSLNRIASAGESGANTWTQSFAADRYGNLWQSSLTGNIPAQSLMPTGQSFFNTATNQLTGVSYDAAGNQTVFGSFTLAYDAEGRQISAAQTASPTVTYAYDGLGERVSKTVAGGITTTYVHDAFGNLAAEYNSGGTPSAPPCNTCYLSWDHLGSTRMMTDSTGSPVARHDYLPFGVEIPSGYAGRPAQWGTADNVSAKFTGQERDADTSAVGLDFFQARYHGAAQGRFLSADPAGNFVASSADPQSWNMYAYARNNPLTFVDPSGTDYCGWSDGSVGPAPEFGGLTEEECGEAGGTWQSSWDITDNVNQYNSQQITISMDQDAWLAQWSAESGPFGGGLTIDILGPTAPLGNPNAPFLITPRSASASPVPTVPAFTVALGTSGGCNLGPVTGVAFFGFILDSHGNSGLYGGYGGGLSGGASCSVGVQTSVSNGNSICAFGGPFYNISGTGGFGLAGTADYFIGEGDGPGNQVQGGGTTVGLGGGGSASATYTTTGIVPFGHQCTEDGKLR